MHKNVIPSLSACSMVLAPVNKIGKPWKLQKFDSDKFVRASFVCLLFCKLQVNRHLVQLSNIWAMCLLEESYIFSLGLMDRNFGKMYASYLSKPLCLFLV